jgi:hypothetical protein
MPDCNRTPNSARTIKSKKFQGYVDRLNTQPFLQLLATNSRVSEREAMRAYGFTPKTIS